MIDPAWFNGRGLKPLTDLLSVGYMKVRNHFHNLKDCPRSDLGGGFKYFYFHPYLVRWFNLTNMLQMGWNHQLVIFFQFKQDKIQLVTAKAQKMQMLMEECKYVQGELHWQRLRES